MGVFAHVQFEPMQGKIHSALSGLARCLPIRAFLRPPLCPLNLRQAGAALMGVQSLTMLGGGVPLEYNRDIRPILSEQCFTCHGFDTHQRKGGLRLDVRDEAIRGGKSGKPALTPGKPESSELVRRFLSADPDEIMPPSNSDKSLSMAQRQTLSRWIAEGASYQEHWAFIPPKVSRQPDVQSEKNWVRNPIDSFVAARLDANGLSPRPEADRVSLIRRVTFDLTGLPPTPSEVDEFVSDADPLAYENLVRRLLNSPHYGERMAIEWLDAARYADTHGYHIDSARDMTAWRDWVIRAFNENKPFDQFTIEQLAGDLLTHEKSPVAGSRDADLLIASGFNRNHMINYEGGAIPEEYAAAYVHDRVNATATVWLGLTMACAQCHDHKYDPLTMRDYYSFYAFFNNVPENGLDGRNGNAEPVLRLPSPAQVDELAKLKQTIEESGKRIQAPNPELDIAQAQWEAEQGGGGMSQWVLPEVSEIKSEQGTEFRRLDDGSFLAVGPAPDRDVYTFTLKSDLSQVTAVRVEALADDGLPSHGPGRHPNGNIGLSDIRIRGAEDIKIATATADFSQTDHPVSLAIDGGEASAWTILPQAGSNHFAVFELEHPLIPQTNAAGLTVRLVFHSPYGQHQIGRVRVSLTGDPHPKVPAVLSEAVRLALLLAPDQRTDAQRDAVRSHYRDHVSPVVRQWKEKLASLRKQRETLESKIPTSMVMGEMGTPRETHILTRGQYDQKGDVVTAATPVALPPLAPGEPSNRLGLARWLVSANQPLTPRVIVNRYWQMYFGQGLVKSAENLGSQGDWPTHPELLDWLAVEFVRSGWNVKHMQELIVTSGTYRQSSSAPRELVVGDPENRMLSRGPRVRLGAEFIRDLALSVSGLLNPRIGGESVLPYQPSGLWEELMSREDNDAFTAQKYSQDHGEKLYRRTMYTFVKRTAVHPSLATFDAPDRQVCTVRRPRTNTPLQALALMNDPTYVEASRVLGERLLSSSSDDIARIDSAFRLVLARTPRAAEMDIVRRLLQEQRAHFESVPDAAGKLLRIGERPVSNGFKPSELAAWTVVASTLLNLDEAITKG